MSEVITLPPFLLGVTPYKAEPYPFTELQEKCILDLETTDAPQAYGYLERIKDVFSQIGFCCLGRFCIAAGAERVASKHNIAASFSYGEAASNNALLPENLATALRMSDEGGFNQPVTFAGKDGLIYSSLVNMNDSGLFTFKEIAAYIRFDPWNVFFPEGSETYA